MTPDEAAEYLARVHKPSQPEFEEAIRVVLEERRALQGMVAQSASADDLQSKDDCWPWQFTKP